MMCACTFAGTQVCQWTIGKVWIIMMPDILLSEKQ